MDQTGTKWNKWLKFGLPLSVWLALSLLSTTQLYSIYFFDDYPMPLWIIAWWQSTVWLLWAMLTPLVMWLGNRYPLERSNWTSTLPTHLAASVFLALLHIILLALLRSAAPLVKDPPLTFQDVLFSSINYFHINLLTYWAIVGIASAFNFYRRWQTQELHGAQLQRQLAQAHLQALQMQLQPHFLFNTLHTIATLVEDDPKLARRMIVRLGDFLRLTLQEKTAEFVTLRREMEFARAYLSIEELRFQDRLQVEYALSPESLEALLPYLILQPLVENAIRHGIAPRSGSGRLELRAELRDDRLRIEVRDNGGQLADIGEGLGLANTRARLAQLYGATAQLTLAVDTNGDTVASIEIPFATSQ